MSDSSASSAPTVLLEESDEVVRLKINTALYTEDVVFRTCYDFTDRCHILLDRLEGGYVIVELRKRDDTTPLGGFAGDFSNQLVNHRVRADVARETKLVRELIVSQAFAEADLPIDPRQTD